MSSASDNTSSCQCIRIRRAFPVPAGFRAPTGRTQQGFWVNHSTAFLQSLGDNCCANRLTMASVPTHPGTRQSGASSKCLAHWPRHGSAGIVVPALGAPIRLFMSFLPHCRPSFPPLPLCCPSINENTQVTRGPSVSPVTWQSPPNRR